MSAKDVCAVASDSQEPVMNMSDDIKLYNKANAITRNDAQLCLQEYSPRFNWYKKKARVLDLGSGDGSVTTILSTFLPSDYEVLVGADINPKTVKFANDNYGNKKIKFVELDIEGTLPDDMKESFDHVFSFYLFHWVDDHQKAFTNIYNALQKNGEFFATFLLFSDVYLTIEMLAKSKKWAPWMPNFDKFPSPYYDFQDPDVHVANMLKNIGFNVLDVRCKQRIYHYESIEVYRDILTAINSFDIPKDIWSEFLEESVQIKKDMHLVDEKGVKTRYNLMVIHCTK
ncbi:juvenile hormone acid O-methyltransferase-like [Manduca sexta]|uniref:juvenile hormone acid O-methyltransferase-like n=1 Tax=Manduca sexta TaxID=7130 RepID=UPI0018902CC5|nr:juvenile hormone acid O-methyltransferase-like [Manduca sexta]